MASCSVPGCQSTLARRGEQRGCDLKRPAFIHLLRYDRKDVYRFSTFLAVKRSSDSKGMDAAAITSRNLENGIDVCPAQKEVGFILWFTGLSGAGKTTLSRLVGQRLRDLGARVEVLDGDVVRTYLSKGLGFSKADRDENIRRIGFVCELLARNGVIAIAAAISPYRAVRDEIRSRVRNFVEIYVTCPIDVLMERDVKGLYRRALAGEISNFTGIDDPYEPPLAPEIFVDSSEMSPEEAASKILETLKHLGLISHLSPERV